MATIETYYASDVVGVAGNCNYEYNSGGVEVSLSSVIATYDEAHLHRYESMASAIAISDSVVHVGVASDTGHVASTIYKSFDKYCSAVIGVSDEASYEFLIQAQTLLSQVSIIDTTHYQIQSVATQSADWIKDTIAERTWTKD